MRIEDFTEAIRQSTGGAPPLSRDVPGKYPDTVQSLCADDDYLSEGNPELAMATEAAAIPAPEDPPSSDSTLNEAIRRLSRLSPLQYDRVRRREAKALGVRPTTLDAVVKDARKREVIPDLPFKEVEPWSDEIDPAHLLTDITATVRRFIVCEKEIAHTVALWVAMTWFIDVVQVAPMAVSTSPEKRYGKSQLLFLLGRLSARSITTSSISPAGSTVSEQPVAMESPSRWLPGR